MVQRTLSSLVVLVASLGFVGLVGSSPASAAPSYADRMESSVVGSTNDKRVPRGRQAVRGNACIDRMAERWARHLAQTNTLTHRRLGRVLSQCDRSYVSENLAKYPVRSGMTAAQVARGTVQAWMESDGAPPQPVVLQAARDRGRRGQERQRQQLDHRPELRPLTDPRRARGPAGAPLAGSAPA